MIIYLISDCKHFPILTTLCDTDVNVTVQADNGNIVPEDVGSVQFCGSLSVEESTQIEFLIAVSPQEIEPGIQ